MVDDLFRFAVKLQRTRPAAPPIEFGMELPRRRRFPRTADRNWRGDAEPDRDSKTGVSAGYGFFGGVTASTETVAARRHAGVHAPLIV